MNHPGYTAGGHRDWDLIAAAIFFIACCLIVSLVLPYRHAGASADKPEPEPVSAARPALIALIVTPEQKSAALTAYRQGMQALRAADYPAASLAFKRPWKNFRASPRPTSVWARPIIFSATARPPRSTRSTASMNSPPIEPSPRRT